MRSCEAQATGGPQRDAAGVRRWHAAAAAPAMHGYDGRADALWSDVPDGATLLRRLGELPGFGAQKSRIFLALLGKQYGVTPPGWREAAGDYGREGSRRSVADITGPASLAEVRATKQQLKQAAKDAKAAQQA